MPYFQAIMFCEDVLGTYGWSEPYYLNSASAAVARTDLETLIEERIKVMSDQCEIVGGRVSDVGVLNDSLLVTNTPLIGLLAATVAATQQPWSAFNCRIEAGSLYRGRHFWHGCLDSTFDDQRRYDPANPNAAAWDTWVSFVQAGTYLKHKVAGVDTYTALTDVVRLREVTHKVGRPFGLLHGRRLT